MATIKLKYVNSFSDRHGVTRHYFRRHRKSYPLPGAPGSKEFMDAYDKLLLGTVPDPVPRKVTPAEGTIAHLAMVYLGSPAYAQLADASKRAYSRVIRWLVDKHGPRMVRQIKRRNVHSVMSELKGTPATATMTLRVLHILLNLAVDMELLPANPATGMKGFASVEIHTWTEQEIAQFEARWPLGTKERLAFAVMLYTGQRASDAARMPMPDASSKMRVVQKKTGTALVLPAHPELLRAIAACPSGHLTVVTKNIGDGPYSTAGFISLLQSAISACGLPPRCRPHGLRKAAARRLAECGCSALEIMAITGHKSLSEVQRYTRAAEQEELGEAAMRKQIQNTKVTNPGN